VQGRESPWRRGGERQRQIRRGKASGARFSQARGGQAGGRSADSAPPGQGDGGEIRAARVRSGPGKVARHPIYPTGKYALSGFLAAGWNKIAKSRWPNPRPHIYGPHRRGADGFNRHL